jgi:hypothetical protein
MDNHPNYIYSWFAVAKIGAILVPINTALKGEPERPLNKQEIGKIHWFSIKNCRGVKEQEGHRVFGRLEEVKVIRPLFPLLWGRKNESGNSTESCSMPF